MKEFFTRRSVLLGMSLAFVAVEICVALFVWHEWRRASHTRELIDDQYKFLSIENWKRFSSVDGGFSALFPGDPGTTNMTVSASTTNSQVHIVYVQANVQNTFAVAWMDHTNNAAWAAGTNGDVYLRYIQASTVSQQPATVVFQQESRFDGYPAREFEFAAGGKANYSVRYKLILVRRRLYMIYIIFLTTDPHPALRAVFFNSFSLNYSGAAAN